MAHINRKAHTAYNFDCLITEGLLKVTDSHVHCKCGNISEMVQDRDVVPGKIAYRIAGIPMTLSNLQGHSSIASLFKWNICTVVQQLTIIQLT